MSRSDGYSRLSDGGGCSLFALALALCLVVLNGNASSARSSSVGPRENPLRQFVLPAEWEAKFWSDQCAVKLLDMEPQALADLMPVQAGLRWVRCPACAGTEQDDTLAWSLEKPEVVTCRRCGVSVPNEQFPAKVPPAPGQPPVVPVETVNVRTGLVHKYPYHSVEPERQRYPDERLYLAAKRDYAAREFLFKAALYAAFRYARQPEAERDPRLARTAAIIVLRYAQVYPSYATHHDQPNQTQSFQSADLEPPFRSGYQTGKGDWLGCFDVPVPLALAYASIRDDPAVDEAGRALGDPNPRHTIEQDLFRASANFVSRQPSDLSESTLYAARGLLCVGWLLGQSSLIRDGQRLVDRFLESAFYFDGSWHRGDADEHRRVLAILDGWIAPLRIEPIARAFPHDRTEIQKESSSIRPDLLALIHQSVEPSRSPRSDVGIEAVSWPPAAPLEQKRHAHLLGGASVARLSVGQTASSLEIDLRGRGEDAGEAARRLTSRLLLAGQPVLGDLDGSGPAHRGWELASASHNTVQIDGLNHRESIDLLSRSASGAEVLFFAADPDFQVVCMEDRHAYPHRASRFRQTIVAVGGVDSYAVSLFEASGGIMHDQFHHAAPEFEGQWQLSIPVQPGPARLLPPSIPFMASAKAEGSRWFIQSLGELKQVSQARGQDPFQATLADSNGAGVRLHLLGDTPDVVYTAVGPGATPSSQSEEHARAAMIVRRQSADGRELSTQFVTVFEPIGTNGATAIRRIGRVRSAREVVLLSIEHGSEVDYMLLNTTPGAPRGATLPDGREVRTDGLAVLIRAGSLVLAGGSFAECGNLRAFQDILAGRIVATGRDEQAGSNGWLVLEPSGATTAWTAGRSLVVRHGDGTCHAWTLTRASQASEKTIRLEVREAPGFRIEQSTGDAVYQHFPQSRHPGPHRARLATIARGNRPE